jgi:hypothetical protein
MIGENGQSEGLLPSPIVSREPAYLPPEKVRRLVLGIGSWLQGNTVIFRREPLIEAGGFIPELLSFTDGFIELALALKHGACFIPEPLAAWRRMNTTYSVLAMADRGREMQMRRTACELMRTKHRDIFPDSFPDVWDRDMAFQLDRVRLAARVSSVATSDGSNGRHRGLLSSAVRTAQSLVRRARHWIDLGLLFTKLRPWQAVRRRLHRMFHRLDSTRFVAPVTLPPELRRHGENVGTQLLETGVGSDVG